MYSVLREVRSLFQSEFSIECNLAVPVPSRFLTVI
jgi:hypothetical protein